MIKHLRYFHGTGQQKGSGRPKGLTAAVSVDASMLTNRVLQCFKTEDIDGLAGVYGDATTGDPVGIDRLEIETHDKTFSVTIYDRSTAPLFADSNEIQRL